MKFPYVVAIKAMVQLTRKCTVYGHLNWSGWDE